jgi:hypothetical protein
MMLLQEARTTEPGVITLGAEPTGAERRRGLRIRQQRPIKIFEPTSHRYFGGQTRDVSATGLRIELPRATPVRIGNMVNVHVGLSEKGEALANRRQMIPARVVWIDRSEEMKTTRVTAGVEFISSIAAHLDAA